MRITDEWFDGEVPNPLHPIGALIDPMTRTVTVEWLGQRVTLGVGDSLDHDGTVTRKDADEPSVMETWRDQ